MTTKNVKSEEKILFNKEQILSSKKYANERDVCKTVIPDDFIGTLEKADTLIERFMKGKVK